MAEGGGGGAGGEGGGARGGSGSRGRAAGEGGGARGGPGGEGGGAETPEAPAEAAPPFQPAPKITGFRDHALQQIQSRDGGVGVNDNALQDAFEHPVKSPQYVPDQYGGTYKYVGKTRQCA